MKKRKEPIQGGSKHGVLQPLILQSMRRLPSINLLQSLNDAFKLLRRETGGVEHGKSSFNVRGCIVPIVRAQKTGEERLFSLFLLMRDTYKQRFALPYEGWSIAVEMNLVVVIGTRP